MSNINLTDILSHWQTAISHERSYIQRTQPINDHSD